jgi:uncharacterized protein YciI
MRFFAIIRTRGEAWRPGVSLERQEDWTGHARFMDELESSGFVVLGGPLEGTEDALLIIRAESPEEISSRLAADPWTALAVLRTGRIAPWTLRLGSLPA